MQLLTLVPVRTIKKFCEKKSTAIQKADRTNLPGSQKKAITKFSQNTGSMKHKIWFIASIIFGFILIRHFYLYHTGDTKELMIWLKGNLGWKAALIAGVVYVLMLSIPFFPGIELAWLVILLFGKDAVYVGKRRLASSLLTLKKISDI
ncbi:hypothetical protein KKI24_30755 [bacterium]|nr:hypothetical protein [bacterium]